MSNYIARNKEKGTREHLFIEVPSIILAMGYILSL